MVAGWLAILSLCSWSLAAPDPGGEPVSPLSPPSPALEAPLLLAAPALEPVPGAEAGGSVVLLLLVDEQGRVERAEVLSGGEPLAAAALAIAEGMRFEPAREDGQPVAVQLDWTLEFPPAPAASAPPVEAPGPEAPAAPVEPGLVGLLRRPTRAPDVRTLDAEQIAVTPGTLGDPVRAVSNLPGLVRTPLDAGWLLVRGGGPEDTGLFVDGVRVPLVYHLGGLTSVLHPGLVQEIAFIPSGQGARYGRATSGVVDLRTRTPGRALGAEARVDLVSSGLFAETPLGRAREGGLALSLRRSYLDAVLDMVPGITAEEASIAPRFWDWGASAGWRSTALLAFGYDDRVEVPNGEGDDTASIRVGTARVHGRQTLALGAGELLLAPFFAREWSTILAEELTDERLSTRGGGRLERADPGEGPWGWSAGLEGEAGRWEMSVDEVRVGGPFASLDPYAALRLGDERALTLGARAETLFLPDQLPRAAPSGRLGLRLPLDARWTALADLGLYHAWPPLDVTLGLPGGAYLPLSRSWGGGAGLRLRRGAVEAELDAWGRALSRLAVLEDDSSLGLGRGVAYGVEALLALQLGPLQSRTCATLSRSLRQDEPGHPWEPYLFDQPLVLQSVLAVALGDALTLAGRFRYASGFPRDPEVDEAYDILSGQTRSLEAWPERLPPFHALDLKLSRRIPSRRWALEGYLDVQNVYNRRVPEPAITGVTWQPIFYSYGLPILPIFGLQGSFRDL